MKKILIPLLLTSILVLFTIAPSRVQAQTQPQQKSLYQSGAYYVRLKAGASVPKASDGSKFVRADKVAGLKSLQKEYGIKELMQSMSTFGNEVLGRTFLLEFENTAESEALLRALREMEEVETVERVTACYIASASVDAGLMAGGAATGGEVATFGAGAGSTETAENEPKDEGDPFYDGGNSYYRWHLDLINAENAWAQQTGKSEVIVAVIDNAIWGEHPDLQIPASRQYNVLTGEEGSSAPPSSVDPETNCTSLSTCYSFNWSHGTHCAGAIGAINNNGTGIRSIGSGVSVMGISCPSTAPEGLVVQNGFAGVSYAAEHGAKVISLSWGSYLISETERAVIAACIDNGIVVVAAAGNDGYKDSPFYPANLPGVISIAAVNSDKTIARWGAAGSNYGNWVCLAAPGGYYVNNGTTTEACIFSTTYCTSQNYRMNGIAGANGQRYDGMFGTSMATPVTAGLCGLLVSADPSLNSYEVREILMASAQELNTNGGRLIQTNSGVIDAAAALTLMKDRKPAPRRLSASRAEYTNEINLTWEAPEGASSNVAAYEIYLNGVKLGQVEAGTTYTDHAGDGGGLYHYGVRAVYADGTGSLRTCFDLDIPTLWQVETSIRPEGCGTVIGGGYYPERSEIQLIAIPTKGCRFTRWMEDGNRLGTDSILDYSMVYSSTLIEAVFSGTPDPDAANEDLFASGQLKVYPNPVSENILNVEATGAIYRLEIYNLAGLKVLQRDFDGKGTESVQLNVNNLNAGVYLLKVYSKNGIATTKVVRVSARTF